ncbi:MAG: hypothetical protein PVI21_03465 [Candidatus Woesebacteria bacterium]
MSKDHSQTDTDGWEVRLVTLVWRIFNSSIYIVAILSLALIDISFGATFYSLWFKFLPAYDLGLFVLSVNVIASISMSVITSGVQISFWANIYKGKDGIFYIKRSDCVSFVDYALKLLPAVAVIGVMLLDTLADCGGFTRASLGDVAAQNVFPSNVPFGWWIADLVIMLALSFNEKIAASFLVQGGFLPAAVVGRQLLDKASAGSSPPESKPGDKSSSGTALTLQADKAEVK